MLEARIINFQRRWEMSNTKLQNSLNTEYKQWLHEIKQKFQSSQIKASIQVNSIWGGGFLFGQQAVAQIDNSNTKQVVSQILQIPWGHNIAIIQKCKTTEEKSLKAVGDE